MYLDCRNAPWFNLTQGIRLALSITELATGGPLGSQIIVSRLTEQQQVCSLALSVNSKSAYRAAAGVSFALTGSRRLATLITRPSVSQYTYCSSRLAPCITKRYEQVG